MASWATVSQKEAQHPSCAPSLPLSLPPLPGPPGRGVCCEGGPGCRGAGGSGPGGASTPAGQPAAPRQLFAVWAASFQQGAQRGALRWLAPGAPGGLIPNTTAAQSKAGSRRPAAARPPLLEFATSKGFEGRGRGQLQRTLCAPCLGRSMLLHEQTCSAPGVAALQQKKESEMTCPHARMHTGGSAAGHPAAGHHPRAPTRGGGAGLAAACRPACLAPHWSLLAPTCYRAERGCQQKSRAWHEPASLVLVLQLPPPDINCANPLGGSAKYLGVHGPTNEPARP